MAAMKVFLLLALAVLGGCQTEISEEVVEEGDEFLDFKWEFEEDFLYEPNAFEKMADLITLGMWKFQTETELGKEISAKAEQSAHAIEQYVTSVGRQVDSLTYDLGMKVGQESEQLVERLDRELQKSVQQLQSQAESYADQLKQNVQESLQDVQTKSISLVQNVHSQLSQSAKELQQNVASFSKDVVESMTTQFTSFWESLKIL